MIHTSPHPAARSWARRAALQALYQWQLTGEEPYAIEKQFLSERPMGKADLIYFKDLLSNVPKHVAALDAALVGLLDRPVAQVDPVERAILRMAAYELRSRPDVPWRTVITEAVKLAKTFGAEQSHRYVNGVLDKLARSTPTLGNGHHVAMNAADLPQRKSGTSASPEAPTH